MPGPLAADTDPAPARKPGTFPRPYPLRGGAGIEANRKGSPCSPFATEDGPGCRECPGVRPPL